MHSSNDIYTSIDNTEQLTNMLEIIGYSFMTYDISIFSQNLKAIEELHIKWNLYAKVIYLIYNQYIFNIMIILVFFNNSEVFFYRNILNIIFSANT